MALSYKHISIQLNGLTPIMFDRYPGDIKTTLEPGQMLYFAAGSKQLILPSANLYSFLTAVNTTSAPKAIYPRWKAVCLAVSAYVAILDSEIPFLRDGKPIVFHGFKNGRDEKAKMYVHYAVARTEKATPNSKKRPVLELPWSLSFRLKLFENNEIDMRTLRDLFEIGGYKVGFGTWRGLFGKFVVDQWQVEPGA